MEEDLVADIFSLLFEREVLISCVSTYCNVYCDEVHMGDGASIQVRPLRTIEELDGTVDLQYRIWGYNDLEVESRGILTVASRFAGQMLGAFDGSSMVGFSLAFVALEHDCLHSHRVGVLPECQNAGVGRMLKLAQREDALRHGFHSIHWTFDPLQPRNAYFNLQKLGGYARTYLPNLYGITSSPLHGGIPTDRLLIEWDLESPRVLDALAGRSAAPVSDALRIPLAPAGQRHTVLAQRVLQDQLQQAFAAGYLLTGFERGTERENYILEKP